MENKSMRWLILPFVDVAYAAFRRERILRERWDFFFRYRFPTPIFRGFLRGFKAYFKKANTCHSSAHPSAIHLRVLIGISSL
jgi:hypothetical protein